MKHKLSLFLLLLVAWLPIGAYAQVNRLYIPGIKMSRGGEATLSVYMDNVVEVTAVEFTLEVPTGFTINPVSAVLSERAKEHQITARKLKNGNYKFVVMSSTNKAIEGIAGRLFTMRIKASESVSDDGDYPMSMSSAVMGVESGDNVLQETDGGIITIKSMPNLHVVSLDFSEPVAGQPLTVKWKVRNDGRGATDDTKWKDYIWLIPNISAGTSMTGSKLLKSVDNISALASGESYESTVNVTLDERIYGNYDLVVTSNMYGVNDIDFSKTGNEAPIPYDPENADYGFLTAKGSANYITVEEENEFDGVSDNFFYKRINIQVPPLPDIQVPYVVAVVDNSVSSLAPSPVNSAGLASSSAFYSGKNIKVTATIANKGGADVNETYINNVLYISNTPDMNGERVIRLASNTMNLTTKASESATCEFTASIPYDWYGDTYFIVDADVNDAVYELANTENNLGVSSLVNTLLTPGADFEPYNLNVPRQVTLGIPFDVSYKVRNVGPGDPYKNSWTDKVYISTKSTGIDNTAKLIGEFTQTGAYVYESGNYTYEGDNYSALRSVSLDGLQNGTYYIYVKVDANDAIMEYDGEGNNVIVSNKIVIADPDLIAELVSVPEETLYSEDNVAVTWRLKNIGIADIQNGIVKDGFYVSSSPNGTDALYIATVTNTISIVAGGEKTLRANITIPGMSTLDGQRYLFVKTNIDKTIAESNAANNSSNRISAQFEYVEDKVNGTNLSLKALQVNSTATPGESMQVSYDIKNTGTLTITDNVRQELFFSTKKYYDETATQLTVTSTQPEIKGLAAGQVVKANVNVTVPSDMVGGQKYLLVYINRDKVLSEKKYNDNMAESPVYINGNLPNFSVSNLIVPSSITTSESTDITWTLTNTGDWKANKAACEIYLSADAHYDNNDKKIASIASNELDAHKSQDMKATILLEDDVVGEQYLIVKVSSQQKEVTTGDNVAAADFTANQSPLPDLVISDLTYEGTWRGGNTITVKAKVQNIGDDATHKDKWTDVFYLSENYVLDTKKAINLGSKTRVGKMEKDGTYQISAQFNIPATAKGYYVLFAVTDGTTTMVEKSKGNNVAKMTVYVEDENDTPADLVVNRMSPPSRIMAGENITISYNIANQGEFAAKGKLRDVLYMSEDNMWDENDTMVGVVTGDVSIDPGTTISRSVTGRIINMPEGNYYLIVRTNSTHAIAESNYDNNQSVGTSACSIVYQTLSLGQSVTVNTSGLYKLPLHSGLNGKTIGLYLSIPENTSAGLYTAYESVPSTARFERSASDIEADEHEVLIPNVQEGNYYILAQDNAAVSRSLNEFVIDGEQDASETIMTLSAREVQFGATTLSITEGGSNGWLSTEIHGALLDSIMDFRLVREGEMIPAESITFYDQTSTKATFNLNDVATGSYDVVSELPNGTLATLPDGFKIIPGTNVALGVKLDAPSTTHVDGYAPVNIAYANGGNTDIVIRELLLTISGGYLSKTIKGFEEKLTELHIKPDVGQDNRGFVTISPGMQETVNYYFKQTSTQTQLNLYIVK